MKAYLAYGANTNFTNMAERCPGAQYICNVTLNHFRMVFRGVADLVPSRGSKVICALWVITPENEAALDRFEGFPRTYVKRYVTMRLNGVRHRVMFYVMRAQRGECEPSEKYEACLREGYADCGMPIAQIDNAIRRAAVSSVRAEDKSEWKKSEKPSEDEAADDAAAESLMEWYLNNGSAERSA